MYGHSVVFICLMWARWAESEAPPPFIRPEPIIMTSPQGSIHFNYHPLSSVCVRKPGKKTLLHARKGNRSLLRFVRKRGHLCDALWKLGHFYISERFGGTGCPGQTASLSTTSAQPAVRWLYVCLCVCACTLYLLKCVSQYDWNSSSQWHQRATYWKITSIFECTLFIALTRRVGIALEKK